MAKTRGISSQTDEKQVPNATGKNYFLGIGINDYQHFTKLHNARKDIEDVYKTLSSEYHFEAAYAEILTDTAATRNNILKHFKELRAKVTKDDRLLIYYSGHGYNEDELGYWIPVAAAKGEIGDYISNAEVRELIKAIDAKHILLISDSCFSASLLVRDVSRDANSAIDDWERNDSRWVFISGKGVVSDGQKGENSPFAKAIIKQLEEVKEDALNVVRLADNVISSVRFNYEQQAELSPLFGAGHEGGQFIFRKEESEAIAWQNAVNQDVALAYYNFIEKYPASIHQAEAFAKMQAAEDRDDWNNAKRYGGLSDFMGYLQKRPAGRFVAAAKTEIDRIRNSGTKKEESRAQTYAAPSPTAAENRTAPRPQYQAQVSDNQEDEGITPMKIFKWIGYGVAGLFTLFLLAAFFKGMYEGITEKSSTETTVPSTTVTDTGSQTIQDAEKIGTATEPTTKGIDYTDVNDWNKANKSGEGTEEDYENYLKARPNGAFATHAQKRVEELRNKRQQNEDNWVNGQIDKALKCMDNNNYEDARKILMPLRKKYPNDDEINQIWKELEYARTRSSKK